ncbi:MAG: GNAT family N-acetyltransferase [Chloroflexi bacterium]|uniref:GNAT family N-acetyltransferase n=1 Tax=Candidatus Chlorohelix allophototropha TaxID=3003348 RepID=A0A8T7M7M0_9CHLR|nr:GNAT family N-acetyltransferase [Chloroflexota bacterium]WJW69847.1 GNAT family N-acetyltransferase [Chloroflexota bacterium L227-S17]
MLFKQKTDTRNPLQEISATTTQIKETPPDLKITRLSFWEHWITVGLMYRNYRDSDPVFERIMGTGWRKPFSRFVRGPLYYWLLNRGYGLRAGKKLAGQLYLQHRKFLTHVNDLEINVGFRGNHYGYLLMDFAEQEARKRGYRFLTLGVTNSNIRAINLYRKLNYLDQHHEHFFLSRPHYRLPPDITPPPPGIGKISMRPMRRREAAKSLKHFFEIEQRASNPETARVWEKYYRPLLPDTAKGYSFSITIAGSTTPVAHADFFDWGARGGRWRFFLKPELWGTSEEKALLENLIHHTRSYTQLWLSFGSALHHRRAETLARNLGMVERDGERMLMVKLLQ